MNILNSISGGVMPYNKYNNNKKTTKTEYKRDIMDIFSEKVVNKRDLDDMVTSPRCIFKGYLCFTAGTALNSAGMMINKPKITKILGVIGSLLSVYGTYNFVKPYLIKNEELTKTEK